MNPAKGPRPERRLATLQSLPSTLLLAGLFLLPLLCAGCGGDAPVTPPDVQRPPNPGCVAQPPPPSNALTELQRVYAASISGAAARQLTHVIAPTSERPGFATAQQGRVLRFDADDSGPAQVALDLADRIFTAASSESGLVSMALDPAFMSNGHAFVVYSVPPSGSERYIARVARFTYDTTTERFDPSSELIVLEVPQLDVTHSVNHVEFDAAGLLYISLGDQRRTDQHAQNASTLPGSILRIDVSNATTAAPYDIPTDNPFVDSGAPEVYAIGLRNPWRFTIDTRPGAGEVAFVGDVGQDRREELNVLSAGANYGWPGREGSLCFRDALCDAPEYTSPVLELPHPAMSAVVAGYTYLSDAIPELTGRLLFADYGSGSVWSTNATVLDGGARLDAEGRFPISSIAPVSDGEVLFVRYDAAGDDGGLYELRPVNDAPSTFPTRLSETGCVDPLDPRSPIDGMLEYAPVSPLWSDGANKRRAFMIPDGTAIAVDAEGDFVLPVGSVLLKSFGFGERLHETRLLMRTEDGWTGYSYRWNEEQTDAELLDTSRFETLPDGTRWQYPSRSDCFACHTDAAGITLGLEAAQLDDSTLQGWLDLGYFDRRIASTEALRGDVRGALTDPSGSAASLHDRARSYMHTNCAGCHRPGGPGRGELDLRVETPLADTRLCNTEPQEGRIWDVGVWEEQRVIAPSRPDWSIVYLRMNTQGLFRMPTLGTDVIDQDAVALISSWITSIEECP